MKNLSYLLTIVLFATSCSTAQYSHSSGSDDLYFPEENEDEYYYEGDATYSEEVPEGSSDGYSVYGEGSDDLSLIHI